jgi:hypothetical protein
MVAGNARGPPDSFRLGNIAIKLIIDKQILKALQGAQPR